jgi:hypothetical protein
MCEHEFNIDNDPSKRSPSDEEEDDDEENYDDDAYFDIDETYEVSMPQNKDKKRKPTEAVEKAMTDNEVKSYYNQYISVLKDQRQQTKKFNDKQLHEIISQLFHSLQYKTEQPEGQLVFRCCQICYDKNEPVITMKVKISNILLFFLYLNLFK